MRKICACLITVFLVINASGQSTTAKPTALAAIKVPDSLTRSTTELSNYFKEKFASDSDRIKAIFTWEATNISYDVDNMFALTYGEESKQDKITKALKTKSAICEGYAELFNELCNKSGITSMVIEGYTKQKGMVDYVPHAWVAAKLYNNWYFFDPTWSSGYVNNGKFSSSFTYRFFKVKPSELIKTHMPFDPLFQFLNNPVSSKGFYEGNFSIDPSRPSFSFEDTLFVHNNLEAIDKVRNTLRRIEANGVKSTMILQMVQYLRNKELNFAGDNFNAASVQLNDGVSLYNSYIQYKNKQFIPKKEDKEIEKMLSDVQLKLDSATNLVASIKTNHPSFLISITQLNKSIAELQKLLAEEKQFVSKYIKTKKLMRPFLFTKIAKG